MDQPIVKNLTSKSECSASTMTRDSSLSKTDSASKNDTPCLRMLVAFLSGSHSYFDTPRTLPTGTHASLTSGLRSHAIADVAAAHCRLTHFLQ